MRDPTNALVAPLFEGPIDVVGDVHGEIEPLRRLLAQLGYDAHGTHPAGRRLVFVGDLSDRGPDSPAVAEWVMSLVVRSLAQCVLGNHELNILRNEVKHGNAWLLDPAAKEHRPGGEFAHCRLAASPWKERYVAFLGTLPVALERKDLRVVHAAWLPSEIAALSEATAGAVDVHEHYRLMTDRLLRMEGVAERAAVEREAWRHALHDRHAAVPLLPAIGESDERHQMGNPIRVATSGVERLASIPFWSAGKWRMCERVAWWHEYEEPTPVIVGHYWRRHRPIRGSSHAGSKLDLFRDASATGWLGARQRVFCVDYSIGGRYEERKAGCAQFDTRLAAMRWPERELWFESGPASSIEP
ncbi:MAG: metallophosphoesterase [Gammaproteobacteria bacterium]|nr:metallophosphoesterase [Gammaproteobacteria bacterium]